MRASKTHHHCYQTPDTVQYFVPRPLSYKISDAPDPSWPHIHTSLSKDMLQTLDNHVVHIAGLADVVYAAMVYLAIPDCLPSHFVTKPILPCSDDTDLPPFTKYISRDPQLKDFQGRTLACTDLEAFICEYTKSSHLTDATIDDTQAKLTECPPNTMLHATKYCGIYI